MKINKSAQILQVIAKKQVVSLKYLTKQPQLLELFASSRPGGAKRRIIDTCALLAKQGFVSVGVLDGEKIYKLTLKGSHHLNQVALLELPLFTDQLWNGRWYLIAFDIPDTKKAVRNQLIILLKRYKFSQYSKGLWLLPYNPTELLNRVRQQYNLKKEIKLVVADYIDHESRYIRLYNLKK